MKSPLRRIAAGSWGTSRLSGHTRSERMPFARTGASAGWRETMAPEAIQAMSEILGPKLAELGYE